MKIKNWHAVILTAVVLLAIWYFNPGGVVCSVENAI